MTRIEILPVSAANGEVSYPAVAGDKHSRGHTAGQALDALTAQLGEDDVTLVIIQSRRPDHFFDAAQQQRVSELMAHWREARDRGTVLPAGEQAELTALSEAELRASAARAATLAAESGR